MPGPSSPGRSVPDAEDTPLVSPVSASVRDRLVIRIQYRQATAENPVTRRDQGQFVPFERLAFYETRCW